MPIEHTVDEKTGIMHVRRWGAISSHDVEAEFKKRKEDPLVVPNIPVIVDCREVEPSDSPEVVRYIADMTTAIAAELDCGPIAIVVSSNVEYGMARMYMSLTETKHPNTEIFRSYDKALNWLHKQSNKSRHNSPNS